MLNFALERLPVQIEFLPRVRREVIQFMRAGREAFHVFPLLGANGVSVLKVIINNVVPRDRFAP